MGAEQEEMHGLGEKEAGNGDRKRNLERGTTLGWFCKETGMGKWGMRPGITKEDRMRKTRKRTRGTRSNVTERGQ